MNACEVKTCLMCKLPSLSLYEGVNCKTDPPPKPKLTKFMLANGSSVRTANFWWFYSHEPVEQRTKLTFGGSWAIKHMVNIFSKSWGWYPGALRISLCDHGSEKLLMSLCLSHEIVCFPTGQHLSNFRLALSLFHRWRVPHCPMLQDFFFQNIKEVSKNFSPMS